MHLNEGGPVPPRQAESALLSRRRRRKSLGALRAQGANSSTDPTSPEVISSLISSLSTISVPLNSHFDNVPRIDSKDSSDPGLPEVPHTAPCFTIPPSKQHGFGMNYGTHATAEEPPNTPFLHPDDAASSPVIRMARAPPSPSPKSPRSPLSPRFKPFSSKQAETSPRPASRDSHTSVRVAPPSEDTAFGTISTEPGPRVSTANSIASNSSAGRTKSLKGQLGILKKSSREFTSDKESQAIRKTSSHNDSLRHNVPRSRASLRSLHSMANVAEEAGPNGSIEESTEDLVASTPPNKEHQSVQSTPDTHNNPGGIGSGRVIPTRDSSLRHRHSQSSGSKKRRSARHSRYSSTGSKASTAENGSPGTSNDAEQVTRRIQEVKDQQQKIKTELESDDSPDKSKTTPAKQTRPPHSTSHAGQSRVAASVASTDSKSPRPVLNESAPSPLVMTGKSRSGKSGQPLASKPTNFAPQVPKPISEKSDHAKRYRRSLEPLTPTKQHRRSPSGHVSAGRSSINTERPSSADSIDLAVEDYVFSPKLTQRVYHPTTGRTIAFSEVGNPKGHVVLCCLGMGLTRYLMAFYDELARTLNLRLVTLDRPGVGESGPHQVDEPSTPLSWPGKSSMLSLAERI